jgi:hypothetical protein
MESVEISECDDTPLELFGDAAGKGQALHWRAALMGREVFAKQSVFVNGKIDHEKVEN